MAQCLPTNLRETLLAWLDDILLQNRTVDSLCDNIRILFKFCSQFNIKLHPSKCVVFAKDVRWCGRLISEKGVKFDPRNLDGLLSMQPPQTGSHLQQLQCALQWVKFGIPDFIKLTAPLQKFMERVYQFCGKRTKRSVARVRLSSLGWSDNENAAFENCKNALANQMTLAHRDESKRVCVYMDASDKYWSGIMTQVPVPDLRNPHSQQAHEPLAFLSGQFNSTQLGWPILEKEACAVLATLTRLHWLASIPHGFDLYTDHNNLIFIFDPLSVVPDLSQNTVRKVLRWAIRLSLYNYTCFHIRGLDNVRADLLGLWSAPSTVRRIVHICVLPPTTDKDFVWPREQEISDIQNCYRQNRPANLSCKTGLWRNPNNAVWVPDEAADLQLRLCIIAHCGPGGHRGSSATEHDLRKYYFWSTLTSNIRTFVQACIHCISTVGGQKIPRSFGPSVHGTKPNDLSQFDYVEMARSKTGEKYILMIRDDHSNYKWFFAFDSTSAKNAAHAILDWCAAFGVPSGLMSDGPTHFRNKTLRQVSRRLKVPHHFTLPYTT